MIYTLLTDVSAPYLRRHLSRRALRGKEDPARLDERYGVASSARPQGRLVWFHAASVGEAVALLALITAILARHTSLNILVTSGTLTSANMLAKRLPSQAMHQYIPLDRRAWVNAFLDHWQPDAAIWTEAEIWPNMLRGLKARNIPSAMVNGRLSENSAKKWRLIGGSFKQLLQIFSVRLAQSEEDAERLSRFGVPFRHVGNLKLAVEPAPVDEAALNELKQAIGARPLWLAASTHSGEEEIIFSAHRQLAVKYPDLLTIIVPRHSARGAEIAIQAQELSLARRSLGQRPDPQTQIYLADTMGELGTLYHIARIVFIGGSLTFDGHSPVEAAQCGAAIVYGPLMRNNASIAAILEEAGAAKRIADGDGLTRIVQDWLGDSATVDEMSARARNIGDQGHAVVARIMAELQPLFDAMGLA
jgi:3-deoxy-D-manno-octulosonic-acid transferase